MKCLCPTVRGGYWKQLSEHRQFRAPGPHCAPENPTLQGEAAQRQFQQAAGRADRREIGKRPSRSPSPKAQPVVTGGAGMCF